MFIGCKVAFICGVIVFIKKSEVYLSDNSPEFDFISAVFFLTDLEGHRQKNYCFRMRILHLSFFIVDIVKVLGEMCMVLL